jgi:geranylgeranyl diphosphate synthase, type I
MPTTLPDYFTRLLPIIEEDLHRVLLSPADYPPQYYRMLHYHMGWIDDDGHGIKAETGKRIRPMLALIAAEAVGSDAAAARPAAAAVELIHNFSLLHDDIQDGSPLRRGRKTAWRVWGKEQSINAGDAMFALAYLAIPRLAADGADPAILHQLTCILGETCVELTRGQHLDMLFETQDRVSTDDYLSMIAGKTAALIAASAEMGALSAGADEDQRMHYREFGRNLGLAFQVLDDVLDIWGDPNLTGKKGAVDIYDRKKSLPVLYGLARSPELNDLYNERGKMNKTKVKQAITLLDKVGARSYAEGLARQYSDATLAELEAASPSGKAGEALYEIVDYLLKRNR